MAKKTKSNFEKMLDEIGKNCGRYWSDYDAENYDDEYEGKNAYAIECAEDMADDVAGIIESYGYEILEESDFCGSSYDGVIFIIQLTEEDL